MITAVGAAYVDGRNAATWADLTSSPSANALPPSFKTLCQVGSGSMSGCAIIAILAAIIVFTKRPSVHWWWLAWTIASITSYITINMISEQVIRELPAATQDSVAKSFQFAASVNYGKAIVAAIVGAVWFAVLFRTARRV